MGGTRGVNARPAGVRLLSPGGRPVIPLALILSLLPVPPASSAECTGGLGVSLKWKSPEQGGVSLVEISAPASAADAITATWDGKPVPVWRESPRGPWRALVGVDVERKPGPVALVVTAEGKPPRARAAGGKARAL